MAVASIVTPSVTGVPKSIPDDLPDRAMDELSHFRRLFYECLSSRGDELFELVDAVLCADGPVTSLVDLTLTAEHRRGHGTLYDGLNHGRLQIGRFRRALVGLPLPRTAGDRLVLAVDVSPWLRPDAATSAGRSFCHTYGRSKDQHLMIPGWPYSVIAALETGRTSWTAVLDAVRLEAEADVAAVTAAQVRDLVIRLIEARQWRPGEADILLVFDAGYDLPRLAFLLADLPVEVLGRLRSDRVLRRPAPSRREHCLANPAGGRPPKHGGEFRFADPATWHTPDQATSTQTTRYGTAIATAWDRLHHRLTRRAAWIDHDGELPIIEGTLIRLTVQRLPGDASPKPVWLWSSATGLPAAQIDLLWQAFLRRFDLEHTFRLWKQTLGWTAPKIRNPQAADLWTWLIIAAYTQLRLARHLVEDLRRPWEKPAPPGRLTPARVRRGFRNIRPAIPCPARAPKPSKPGPGRPPGSRNRSRAPRYNLGKVNKRPTSLTTKRDLGP
ncbi:NF041680 family putative transposase [Nonomuraea sp. NPDC049695]|uniref:NF041680 family putative transposase n=1 Tax=Nonomuraea sp. NPDC049695 TaxID=3154734 RepID=UPI00344402F5